MTKEEFLNLTTIFEMSDEDFEKVNCAYMELENMGKLEFCKLYIEDTPSLLGMLAGVISKYRREARKNIDCIDIIAPFLLKAYHEDTLEPLAEALDTIEKTVGERKTILHKAEYSGLFSDKECEYLVNKLR